MKFHYTLLSEPIFGSENDKRLPQHLKQVV